jgi:hypothetical protein
VRLGFQVFPTAPKIGFCVGVCWMPAARC